MRVERSYLYSDSVAELYAGVFRERSARIVLTRLNFHLHVEIAAYAVLRVQLRLAQSRACEKHSISFLRKATLSSIANVQAAFEVYRKMNGISIPFKWAGFIGR